MRIAARTTAGLAAAAVLAAAGAGCGGSGSTSTQSSATAEWADGLCTAVTSYKSSLTAIGTTLKSAGASKPSLQQAATHAKAATQSFVDSLQGLGKPGTESGGKASSTLQTLSAQLKDDAGTIQDATGSDTGVVSAVSVVSTTLVTAKGQVKTALDELQSLAPKDELQQAFSQAPSCSSLSLG
jgi:hypothetical protein